MKRSIAYLVCLLATSGALASDYSMNTHLGPFAEVNLGTNLLYFGPIIPGLGGAALTGASWSGALGYNLTPGFGLEAGFMQNYGSIDNNNHINVPYATTRFTVPIGERYSFIGKLGAMYPNDSAKNGIILPFTGVGVGYALNQKVDLHLIYQGAVYGIAGAGQAGLGLTYHFN